jgi:uncharacterized protein YdeI (YjbR/CyaY-like superfamily)
MNPQVDHYFAAGCGRCPLGGTPDCKVHNWQEEMAHLRMILLDSELTEEVKWSVPCYTFQGSNVLIMSALKNHLTLDFFKGSLLKDPHHVLQKPGKNSQAVGQLRFTSVEQVTEMETIIREYIQEAIEVEKAGLKVDFKKESEPMPEELERKLEEMPQLKAAFEALTPGRQRGYILYFSAAKQSKTRVSRIEKYIPKILAGKGFHDR